MKSINMLERFDAEIKTRTWVRCIFLKYLVQSF